jgi:hypothetical protein
MVSLRRWPTTDNPSWRRTYRTCPASHSNAAASNTLCRYLVTQTAAPKFYRQEGRHRVQRHAQKVRAGAQAAKITNRRRHFFHVMSHGLVRHYAEIHVADVSPKMLRNVLSCKSSPRLRSARRSQVVEFPKVFAGGFLQPARKGSVRF